MKTRYLISLGFTLISTTAAFGQNAQGSLGYRACYDFMTGSNRCQIGNTPELAKALARQACLHSYEANNTWLGAEHSCKPDDVQVSPILANDPEQLAGPLTDLDGTWISEKTECSDKSPPLTSLQTTRQRAVLTVKNGKIRVTYTSGTPWFGREIDTTFKIEGQEMVLYRRPREEALAFSIDKTRAPGGERLVITNAQNFALHYTGIGGVCPANTQVITIFRRSLSDWSDYAYVKDSPEYLMQMRARAQEAIQIPFQNEGLITSLKDKEVYKHFSQKLCAFGGKFTSNRDIKAETKLGELVRKIVYYFLALYDSESQESFWLKMRRDDIRDASRALGLTSYNIFPSEYANPQSRGSFFQATFQLADQLSEVLVRGVDYECE